MDAKHDSEKRIREVDGQETYAHAHLTEFSQSSGENIAERRDSAVLSPRERAIAERRLVHKLDLRFEGTIVILYIMNYITRNSISTARLKGLEHDLHLTDTEYDSSVAILFVSYILFQVPFNMILNRMTRPSLYIGSCAIIWGTVCALIGITHNFAGIFVCRLIIGLPEAAFFPGSMYLLSRWYTRKELAFRTSITIAGIMCSSAFGSLIAAGILSNLEGERGIRGWRWVFIIEGAITVAIGVLSLWALPDLPSNTRWLSPAERQLAQTRIAEDTSEADEDLAEDSMWSGFKMAIKDIKVPIFSLIIMTDYLGLSFTNFFPTLTETLGFSDTLTLLLAAPPWIFGAIVCCINGLHADKTGERFFHICNTMWGTIIGFIIGLSTLSVGGRYVSLFLLATGHGSLAVTLAWVSNTIPRPPAKRAAAIGIVTGVGNAGNLIGSYVWKTSWGPEYHQSMAISLAAIASSSVLTFVLRCILKRMDKKLDKDELDALIGVNRERVEDAARLEGITFEEALEKRKGFRYLY